MIRRCASTKLMPLILVRKMWNTKLEISPSHHQSNALWCLKKFRFTKHSLWLRKENSQEKKIRTFIGMTGCVAWLWLILRNKIYWFCLAIANIHFLIELAGGGAHTIASHWGQLDRQREVDFAIYKVREKRTKRHDLLPFPRHTFGSMLLVIAIYRTKKLRKL